MLVDLARGYLRKSTSEERLANVFALSAKSLSDCSSHHWNNGKRSEALGDSAHRHNAATAERALGLKRACRQCQRDNGARELTDNGSRQSR
jgi:hypothetical protein